MSPENRDRVEMIRVEIKTMEAMLRAMSFELALMLDEARGFVEDDLELAEAA
jgi:hypothetical protein